MTHPEPGHDPTTPVDAFDGPAVDGPFVEVTPGTWVRAAAIVTVQTYTDRVWHELKRPQEHPRRREYLTSIVVTGVQNTDEPGNDPAGWRSPFSLEQLRTACRLAEYHEERRRLETVAWLAALHARRDGDGH